MSNILNSPPFVPFVYLVPAKRTLQAEVTQLQPSMRIQILLKSCSLLRFGGCFSPVFIILFNNRSDPFPVFVVIPLDHAPSLP